MVTSNLPKVVQSPLRSRTPWPFKSSGLLLAISIPENSGLRGRKGRVPNEICQIELLLKSTWLHRALKLRKEGSGAADVIAQLLKMKPPPSSSTLVTDTEVRELMILKKKKGGGEGRKVQYHTNSINVLFNQSISYALFRRHFNTVP